MLGPFGTVPARTGSLERPSEEKTLLKLPDPARPFARPSCVSRVLSIYFDRENGWTLPELGGLQQSGSGSPQENLSVSSSADAAAFEQQLREIANAGGGLPMQVSIHQVGASLPRGRAGTSSD